MPPNRDPCPEGEIGSAIEGLERSLYQEKWDKAMYDDYLAKIKTIRARINTLERLSALKKILSRREDEKYISKIDKIKSLSCQGKDDDASERLKQIEKELDKQDMKIEKSLETKKKGFEETLSSHKELAKLLRAGKLFYKSHIEPATLWHFNMDRAEAWLNFYSGVFIYWALIFALVLAGLQVLYVNEGSTFGANPFSDYVKVLTWGLAAEIAGRTLIKPLNG